MNIEISKTIKLQSIVIDDFDALRDLMRVVYVDAYAYLWPDGGQWYLDHVYNVDTVRDDIKEEGSELFFVLDRDVKVGILKVQWDLSYPDRPTVKGCRLHRLYLAEAVHGTGIANDIMKYVEDRARSQGAEILWLDCMDSEPRALRFYEKHGFAKGRLYHLDFPELYDRYRGIFLMHKDLE